MAVPAGVTERDPSNNSATDVDAVVRVPGEVFWDSFEDGTTDWWSLTVF